MKIAFFAFFAAFLVSISALACRLAEDRFVLLENGRPVRDFQSFMIEREKDGSEPLWLPCRESRLEFPTCLHRQGQIQVSATSSDEIVLCRMPAEKYFLSMNDWAGQRNLPAKACPKTVWGPNSDGGVAEIQCRTKLYGPYLEAAAKSCKRIVFKIPPGKLGLIPKLPDKLTPGPVPPGSGCDLSDRCLRFDVATLKIESCSREEISKAFPGLELKN